MARPAHPTEPTDSAANRASDPARAPRGLLAGIGPIAPPAPGLPGDLAGLAWWEYDAATDTHVWSDQMWVISGLDPALGAPNFADWLAMIQPDDRAAAAEPSQAALTSHPGSAPSTNLAVFRMVRPNGEVRLLQSWHSTRVDATGTVTGLFGTTLDVTERLAADRVVEEIERRLLAAQRITGLALWSMDIATGDLSWSDEMFALVGREPGSVAPTLPLWLEHLHPDDLERSNDLRRSSRSSGRGYENVLRIYRLDGELRWLQTWSNVELEDGQVVREWGVSLDVTERESAAAARVESEHRLAAAYELTGLAWWEWTFGVSTLSWSEGMRTLVGLTPDEPALTIDEWLGMVDVDDQFAAAELERIAIRDGTPYLHVFRVRLRDGRTRHLQSWSEPLRDHANDIIGLRGATLDVTERTLHERALAESEGHFRAAFDHAPNAMAMVSLTGETAGQLVRANPALAALIGCEPDELLRMRLPDWTFPEDLDEIETKMRHLVAGHPIEAYERRFRRKDGSAVHAWVTLSLVRDAEDRPLFVIAHLIDETQLRLQQQELELLAHTDHLTGLANRTVVNEELERSLARVVAPGQPAAGVGLLLLDVDRFKLVNDTLGHPVGDSLLVLIAHRLVGVIRGGATVGRLGGDEFIVIINDATGPEQLEIIAQRVLVALRQPYELPSGDTVITTSSLGIAYAEVGTQSPEALLRQADLALYNAKDNGRARWSAYDDQLHARTLERVHTEAMVRSALRDGGLRVVLQPVVSLATGQVIGAEALVRIVHPEHGEISPAVFIDIAEDTGLIAEIDGWVVEEVVRLLALDQPGSGGPGLGLLPARIAVNVSGRTIEQPTFVPRLADALEFYGVPGERILVELTESTLLDDNAAVVHALLALDELGIDTGIDDFGTGYSALAYLQRFALSFLKIDLSFVRQLGTGKRANAVVAAIIDLAHAHDLLVTAEGVETQEQADLLLAMGCDHAQGWLFGRPVAPDQLASDRLGASTKPRP